MNEIECPSCIGTGEVIFNMNRKKDKRVLAIYKCKLCKGTGQVNEDVTINYESNLINEIDGYLTAY
jgi:DnaJ-class molecular chaperone